jgi:peptidoglycan/xylan/chitin deacetylase (PgdA/CDA1 family)
MSFKSSLFKSALLSLHKTGIHSLMPARVSGVGVIFMLHRVRPAQDADGFAPNGILEITPEYLNSVLSVVAALGYDFVSLDEAKSRLLNHKFDRKFAAFTLDDGYHDNLEFAAPIFSRHNAPFTVYVSSGMPDGTTELWWMGLEEVIRQTDRLQTTIADRLYDLPTSTVSEKQSAFDAVYWPIRSQQETEQRAIVRNLCEQYGVDLLKITSDCSLTWDGVRELDSHAFCCIGAHTIDHYALSKLSDEQARHELVGGADRIKQETGNWPRHLAYPYGDKGSAGPREYELSQFLGFDTATTTNKGFLSPKQGTNLLALPRLSLNGDYQDLRMLQVLMSGLPFALASLLPSLEVS